MRLLHVVSKGTPLPLASIPLHIAASGSLEIDQEVPVVLATDAAGLVIDANVLCVGGMPC